MPLRFADRNFCLWLIAAGLGGCSLWEPSAQQAFTEYQSALAANDLQSARMALLEVVSQKDDVPEYWVELGRLETSLGNHAEAYAAFTRAYELNRNDPNLLRTVVELAVRSGDLDNAKRRAEELSALSPNDNWIGIVQAWSALREGNSKESVEIADRLLSANPYDPIAVILKARGLLRLGKDEEAIAALSAQVAAQPGDRSSSDLLSRIYQRRGEWDKVAELAGRLSEQAPENSDYAVMFVKASLLSGKIEAAKQATLAAVAKSDLKTTRSIFEMWSRYGAARQPVSDFQRAAALAPPDKRWILAQYFNRIGLPKEAERLAKASAVLPVRADNAEVNAVYADALSRQGELHAAKARLDAVIAFDPGNATALRSRAELLLRTGNSGKAIADCEKLVSVSPRSSYDRLLLSRAYAAAGRQQAAQRALWQGFQDIPADDVLFAALSDKVAADAGAMKHLRGEFERQRDAQFERGLF